MYFEKQDLLTYDDIIILIDSKSPNERAQIITSKLKKYCFFQNGVLYTYNNKFIVYNATCEKKDNVLITMITNYLTESLKNLSKEQRQLIELQKTKEFNKFCENTNVNKNLPQLTVLLQEEEIKFGADYYEIHYKNGYIDLKTLEFKQRMQNKHFVCNYIKRDYIKSSKDQREKIRNILKKIYPKKEDLETILYILGSALTGKATKEQKILFLLGVGSNGKSTIMQITEKAIECYLETLEEDSFSMSNKNPDKTFSSFHGKPYIRMVWINEPKCDKMNATTFKKFCEGEMKGKLLYKNGVHNFNHNALPIFSANLMPNINIDGGVKRRFRGYVHESVFVTDKSKVNEKKHIYMTNRDLLDNIVSEGLLDAWIDILSKFANKWIKGDEIPCPESFQTATDEMIQENDKFQDFIDAKLEITTNGKVDRIGKDDMVRLYKELYHGKNISTQTMISLLKTKIDWDREIRCRVTGIKGCFYNVRERTYVKEDDEEDNEDEKQNTNEEAEKVKTLKDEIKQLKKRIKELEKSNDEKTTKEDKLNEELEDMDKLFDFSKNTINKSKNKLINTNKKKDEEKKLNKDVNVIKLPEQTDLTDEDIKNFTSFF